MGRKRKDEGYPQPKAAEVLPEARFVAPLRKPTDVTRSENACIARQLTANLAREAARLSYMLTSIRSDLEADAPPQIDQTRGPCVDTVIIHGVPTGTFLPKEEIERLNSQFIEQPPALSPARRC